MKQIKGAGLGFRRDLMESLKQLPAIPFDFFEVAPENWIGIGGRYEKELKFFTEQYAFVCHGLSLSLGGVKTLDWGLLKGIKQFMQEHGMTLYTEHLSFCTDQGQLYDLLPLPCTEEAVRWVSQRIAQVQDFLGMQIGVENVSYYFSPPEAEMSEAEFIKEVINTSGCFLHLDVNNVYVNSQNFGFDPYGYLRALPLEKTRYIHVAGHYVEEDGLIIDTHGGDVIDPVWDMLAWVYQHIPQSPHSVPSLLERDFNFPELNDLLHEVERIRRIQAACAVKGIKGKQKEMKHAS